MLGPYATASRRTPHYHSPGVATVASHAACASMSTMTTTTTTTRDRGEGTAMALWNGSNKLIVAKNFQMYATGMNTITQACRPCSTAPAPSHASHQQTLPQLIDVMNAVLIHTLPNNNK